MKKVFFNWIKFLIVGVVVVGVLGVIYWYFVGLLENFILSIKIQIVFNFSLFIIDLVLLVFNVIVYCIFICGCCKGWVEYIK